MNRISFVNGALAAAALAVGLTSTLAAAQSRVQYGRITKVVATTVTDTTSQTVGTIVGGGIGLASGSGQSSSNRALRTLGGAAAGRGVGHLAGRSQAFEYTVLIGGLTTVRIISDQAGKSVGDCVAIEQGQFSNIRLVSDDRCVPTPTAQPVGTAAAAADVQAANACDQAKLQALNADSDEAFALAERRIRLLCGE